MSGRGTPGSAGKPSPWTLLAFLAATLLLQACGPGTIADTGGAARTCVPDCSGKECGDNGCGGSCGTCDANALCNGRGACYMPEDCTADCGGRECGDDGCGGLCGTCLGGELCNGAGTCYTPANCTPDCEGRQCGDDACGGSCGDCAEGSLCNGLGGCYEPETCTPSCSGKECGDDGCGGNCGVCGGGEACNALGSCYDPNACVPSCDGSDCGDDGCGGSCGSCSGSDRCVSGVCEACVPSCSGKSCGQDGCGGSCGACTGGNVCSAAGTCYDPDPCVPSCSGKECGTDGCGGSCGTCATGDSCNNGTGMCVAPVGVVWTDSIQSGSYPYGFDNLETQHPIDVVVQPSDGNGANLSRVPDPAGGGGYAIRHYGRFDQGGARAQLALWSGALDELATSGQTLYVAQEWYFPEPLYSDSWGWLALWDWHSTGPGWGENRWHADPSVNLLHDGSMRIELAWGGTAADINGWSGDVSSKGLPVGEWFDIEMRYQWTEDTTTITVWVNGELFLQQSGVRTKASGHRYVEMYTKFYGQSDTTWSPNPAVKYTRNVRISDQRIWR